MIKTDLLFTSAFSDMGYLKQFSQMLKSEDHCYEDLQGISGLLQVAVFENKVIGGYGLEIFGKDALFRSVIISREFRGTGLGTEIMNEAFGQSKKSYLKTLYLLTTTADMFFLKFGFEVIERNSVPYKIGATTEFNSFCPDTAICMKKEIQL